MEEEVNVTNSSIILLGAPLAVLEVGEVGGAASEVTHAQIESCYNLSCASSSGVAGHAHSPSAISSNSLPEMFTFTVLPPAKG